MNSILRDLGPPVLLCQTRGGLMTGDGEFAVTDPLIDLPGGNVMEIVVRQEVNVAVVKAGIDRQDHSRVKGTAHFLKPFLLLTRIHIAENTVDPQTSQSITVTLNQFIILFIEIRLGIGLILRIKIGSCIINKAV